MLIVPRVRIVSSVFLFALALWTAETWWFGWNLRPASDTEAMCDRMVGLLFVSSLRFWIEVKVGG